MGLPRIGAGPGRAGSGPAPIGGIWNYLEALSRLGGDGLGCNLRYLRSDWGCGRWVNLRTSSERLIALETNLHPELAHSLEKFKELRSGKGMEGSGGLLR